MINTYDTLLEAIEAWLVQDDVSAQAAEFVRLFEAQAGREILSRHMHAEQSGTLDSATLDVPNNYVQRMVWVLDINPLGTLTYVPQDEFFNSPYHSWTGRPRIFTIVGDKFYIAPAPDSDTTYDYTLHYYAETPVLGEAQQSNWLLQRHPDAYLYGSLLHTEPFLMGDERIGLWQNLFDRARAGIHGLDTRSKHAPGARATPRGVTVI